MDADRALTDALGTYLEVVDDVAPGLVEGLYVVGSAALGDWQAGRSDIDIVAVTAEPATGLHRPWALDGSVHHDGESFEINPVTWYTLARYGLIVRGPAPERLGIAVDTEARVRFVVDNLRTYWAPLADRVRGAVADERELPADALEWCTLGPLRLHHTAFTGDVTSKRGAGEHARQFVPDDLRAVIDAALVVRATGAAGVVAPELMLAAADLVDWVVADVDAASRRD